VFLTTQTAHCNCLVYSTALVFYFHHLLLGNHKRQSHCTAVQLALLYLTEGQRYATCSENRKLPSDASRAKPNTTEHSRAAEVLTQGPNNNIDLCHSKCHHYAPVSRDPVAIIKLRLCSTFNWRNMTIYKYFANPI
jgi:hypothetical protein